MDLLRRTRPSPPQLEQGVELSPVPSQREQLCICWNTPRGVCRQQGLSGMGLEALGCTLSAAVVGLLRHYRTRVPQLRCWLARALVHWQGRSLLLYC